MRAPKLGLSRYIWGYCFENNGGERPTPFLADCRLRIADCAPPPAPPHLGRTPKWGGVTFDAKLNVGGVGKARLLRCARNDKSAGDLPRRCRSRSLRCAPVDPRRACGFNVRKALRSPAGLSSGSRRGTLHLSHSRGVRSQIPSKHHGHLRSCRYVISTMITYWSALDEWKRCAILR